MRVLVTGSAGFVGSHVVGRFSRLAAVDDVVELDIGDSFPSEPVDVVISLAATADPHDALRDPTAAYTNGVRVVSDTIEYARQVGARVLHVSTNEVYGPRPGAIYDPRGPYAGAKACQEIVCRAADDVPVTIVVTQSLFGERQQPNKLLPSIVRSLLADEPVTLQRGPGGWAVRPFLHVWNLADALVNMPVHDGPARFHVGASEDLSVAEVARIAADAVDRRLALREIEAGGRAGHEAFVEPIGSDVPHWKPTYFAREAVANTARWYRDHPDWLEPR